MTGGSELSILAGPSPTISGSVRGRMSLLAHFSLFAGLLVSPTLWSRCWSTIVSQRMRLSRDVPTSEGTSAFSSLVQMFLERLLITIVCGDRKTWSGPALEGQWAGGRHVSLGTVWPALAQRCPRWGRTRSKRWEPRKAWPGGRAPLSNVWVSCGCCNKHHSSSLSCRSGG